MWEEIRQKETEQAVMYAPTFFSLIAHKESCVHASQSQKKSSWYLENNLIFTTIAWSGASPNGNNFTFLSLELESLLLWSQQGHIKRGTSLVTS